MLIDLFIVLVGIALTVKGAEYFVKGSSALAKKLRISTLVIGLTLVSIGTSFPELVINIISSLEGRSDIVIGNIIGSNIANTLLILGLAAVIGKLRVPHSTVWKEIPFSFIAAILVFIVANDSIIDNNHSLSYISRIDGIIMILLLGVFFYYIFEMIKKTPVEEIAVESHTSRYITMAILFGMSTLLLGGKLVVDHVVVLAESLRISSYIISATIVAIGTSFPELITTLVAASKGEMDLAVGNIIGSNIFNVFIVLGISAIIRPIPMLMQYNIDLVILLIATALLFIFVFARDKHELKKSQGVTFVMLYIFFILSLIFR